RPLPTWRSSMKRPISMLLYSLFSLFLLVPALAHAARVAVVAGPHRVRVVVGPGYPIHRPLPMVVVRRPAVVVRVRPLRYLPVVIWHPVVVARPVGAALVWQDAETLYPEEDWAETMFDSNQRGDKLYLEVVRGRVQFDFAEVVFGNGETQVVDFGRAGRGPGLYSLLDFRDGRTIDHVRLIARARSGEARVALVMQK
ncbi:MAG TPA: hypothetical protein VMR50_00040, partial [Myxococcota bacterium]|nr:hypothetical protein [Myxococcota bacterium]